jgi:peptidoglycan/xylan/chitin deacetylase (PgdA/CDA1 family)
LNKALVLNYHRLAIEDHPIDDFARIYAVELSAFEAQMQFLKDQNIYVASLGDILQGKVEKSFCVGLTFDDGNQTDYSHVFPILQKHGFTATFFLSKLHFEREALNWDHYRELLANGMSIGAHGISHRDLTHLSSNDLITEIEKSKEFITSNLHINPSLFSLPFGAYNTEVIKCISTNGFSYALSTKFEILKSCDQKLVFGRWSIKQNTNLETFKAVLKQQFFKKLVRRHTSKDRTSLGIKCTI